MDPISIILFVAIGGVMIGAGVHFIPVGGAPAAMATATGVGTGTAMLGTGVFFINSVIASYNIGGTIEGMHDPKFKRIGTGALACAIASVVVGIFCVLLTGGI